MPKLRDLRADDLELQVEESKARQATADQLRAVLDELELYNHPAWKFFAARLAAEEARSIEALVSGDDPGAREHIKIVRHLASIPEKLEEERARLTAELSALEGED